MQIVFSFSYHTASLIFLVPSSDSCQIWKYRNPSFPQSYWPTTLFNVDYNILIKILAARLNSVLVNYVQVDQSDFF